MKRILDFMRKHKWYMVVISVLIFTVPLIIVHYLYKVDCKIEWLQSEWSAGDVLSYIAGFEAFIGTVSLGLLALWQNYQINDQHIESLEPLLSMGIVCDNGILYLMVENTGGVEAKDIRIEVRDICNNGQNNKLSLDGLFETNFELYPKEKVKGRIAISGENIFTEIFPQVRLKVSYIRSDLNRKKEYERTVIYNGELSKNNIDVVSQIENLASDIDKIARADVRIANYLDGCQVAKFDELNILAGKSLKNDLVDVIVTKQKAPICDRTQTIQNSLKNKSQEEK